MQKPLWFSCGDSKVHKRWLPTCALSPDICVGVSLPSKLLPFLSHLPFPWLVCLYCFGAQHRLPFFPPLSRTIGDFTQYSVLLYFSSPHVATEMPVHLWILIEGMYQVGSSSLAFLESWHPGSYCENILHSTCIQNTVYKPVPLTPRLGRLKNSSQLSVHPAR